MPSYILLLFLICLGNKSKGQCLVDYTTANYFCDLDSLYLTAVPVEGVAPYSFIWETGETTQTIIIPLALGDYMLTMTDATGCISVINCHVKPYPEVLYYPYNQNACIGDTVTLYLEWFRDSLPGALYQWSNGATTPTITLTDDLIWSVTVTDPATGCEFTIENSPFLFWEIPEVEIVGGTALCGGGTITLSLEGGPFDGGLWLPEWVWGYTYEVSQPGEYGVLVSNPDASFCNATDTIVIGTGDIPVPQLDGPPDLCNGQTAIVEVTNHLLFDQFLWSNGETDPSFIINSSGTYSVTVTDAGGCTATGSISVGANGGPQLSTDVSGTTCGESNGSIDLTATPPQSFDFIWSNGSTDPDLLNVPAGNYSVTVTDENGCTAISNDIIPDDPIDITIIETIIPNNSCSGFNGSINLFITPVNQSYSFQWSNGETTEDLEDLAPGTYSVTVSTGQTCIESGTFYIDDNSGAADIMPVITSATCGENNGGALVELNGGTGPFNYLWSNGNTTEEIENAGAGTYGITVTGSDGCESIATVIVPNEDPELIISGNSVPNTSCNENNGEIDIEVSPSGNYTYQWSNGSDEEDLVNIGAGQYIVTVTSGSTCMDTATFTVLNENIPFVVSGAPLDNASCGDPNGSIDISVMPAEIYTFAWSSGQSSEDLMNIGGGTYTVTVTNSTGCSITSSFSIENSSNPITITGLTITNTSCQSPNGGIDISVLPAGQYSFLWSTGFATEDLSGITGGTYHVTVTDINSCTTTASFMISDQSADFSLTGSVNDNASCTEPNGSLDITVVPAGAYSFIWSNGAISEDVTGLSAGTYAVTVSDANGCSSTASFSVNSNFEIPEISGSITNEICGDGNGAIELDLNSPGSFFTWSNGMTSEDIVNVPAGTYIVTVTSVSGCILTDTFLIVNVSNNFSVTANVSDNNSCTAPNGSIDLFVTPSGDYNFIWSTGLTTEDVFNLGAGIYTVTVSDHSNCSSTFSVIIEDNFQTPVITPVITSSTCDQSNGSVSISVIPPSGNLFEWSNGFSGEDLNDVMSGTYYLTITSSGGCVVMDTFIVPSVSSSFSVNEIANANTSCVEANGSISLSVTPVGSYSFLWSNGDTTSFIENLTSGTYLVTVTDEFNCPASFSYTVTDHLILPVIHYEVTPASCGQSDGSIDITLSNTHSHSIYWSDGSTSEDRIDLFPGNYIITVIDTNGCTATETIEVPNQNSNFSISGNVQDDNSCTNPSGSIDITVIPPGTYQFNWSNGLVLEDLTEMSSGTYTLTVTDQFNCASSEVFTIENISSPPVIMGEISLPTCGRENGNIAIETIPSTGVEYLWSTGQTISDLQNVSPGTYILTVNDQNGCTAMQSFYLPDSEPVSATLDADLTGIQSGDMITCSLQLNVPLSSIDSILWSPIDMMSCQSIMCTEQEINISQLTEVSVMAIDTSGCIGVAHLLLDIDKEFKVFIPNVFTPNNDGENDMFTVFGNDEIEEVVRMEIFDRWGNQVFVNELFPPNDLNYGWDGTFSDQIMNPAVFAYLAIVRYSNGEEHRFRGDVTLVR